MSALPPLRLHRFQPEPPIENPTPPPENIVAETTETMGISSPPLPPIVNREALRISQEAGNVDASSLFWSIHTVLTNTTVFNYEEIAIQVFTEHLDNFQFLHRTPFHKLTSIFTQNFTTHQIQKPLQKQISKVLHKIFLISALNSSIGKLAAKLNRLIENYLTLTTKTHFQKVIREGRLALQEPINTENLTNAIRQIDKLNQLYTYITGPESITLHMLISQSYHSENQLSFPIANRFYRQFKSDLKERQQDSPLNSLSLQLRSRLKEAIEARLSAQETSAQFKFCNMESEAIWEAGIKLLQYLYQIRFPEKPEIETEKIYHIWTRNQTQDIIFDCSDIMKIFIENLNEQNFQNLAQQIKNLHSPDASRRAELKSVRANILLNAFYEQHPEISSLKGLFDWCCAHSKE